MATASISALREDASRIQPLRHDDLGRLRIDWRARLSITDIQRCIDQLPGLSVWDPETLEYIIAGPWRNRTDIVNVAEIAAVRESEALLRALTERSHDAGIELVLMLEVDERRSARSLQRAGFSHVEQVVTYELDRRDAPRVERSRNLVFIPADVRDPSIVAALVEIDHAAFPWLWWNSAEEFRLYADLPGVEMYLALEDGRPIAYTGFTLFPGWGHLDRIAVRPDIQGRGYGSATLAFTADTLFSRGCRRIGLSTQETNIRSRRLYEHFGFRRTPGHDYDLYGSTRPSRDGWRTIGLPWPPAHS